MTEAPVFRSSDDANHPALGDAARGALLAIARAAIEEELGLRGPESRFGHGAPDTGPLPDEPGLYARLGAFVTLKTGGELRGCIGRMTSDDPLPRTIRDMARAAAFEDRRFPALTRAEYPRVSVEITVLSRPHRITSPEAVTVGLHGILIRRGWNSGVLLPQVAVEYGWDRGQFLGQTCRKAGLPQDAWKRADCEISVFEGLVFGEG